MDGSIGFYFAICDFVQLKEDEQMTKLQKAVVSWLKKNVPVKKTKFAHTHVVQYFSAGRALDALMKVVSSI